VNARDYLTLLRERLFLIVACVVTGLVLAAVVTIVMPTKYASTATFYVVAEQATGQSGGASDSYQGAQLATDRVKSYTELLTGQRVAEDAAAALGGGTTPEQVMAAVSATSVENTVIITLTTTDTSAARAQQIATVVSNTFTKLVRGLETNGGTPAQQPAVSAQVLQPPSLPDSPVSPSWPLNLAIGFVVGLLVGFGAAVVRRSVDVTVRSTDELENVVGAAVLGTVPEDRNARRLPVPLSSIGSGYARTEAFHRIRTALASRCARRIGGTGTVLVVTSAVPGEGRTTTACNLAAALAAVGSRVLLVDGDLREPKVASYLELESVPGLTTVLAGRSSFTDAVQTWSTDGLAVLTSGAPTARPNELVASRATTDLIAWLRPQYDYVIIDAPPLLAVADAANLASHSDGVVLVGRWKVTRRPELESAVSFLRSVSVPIVGAILSRTPDRAGAVRYGEYVPVGSEPAFAGPRRPEPGPQAPPRPAGPRPAAPMPPGPRPTGPIPAGPRPGAPVGARPARTASVTATAPMVTTRAAAKPANSTPANSTPANSTPTVSTPTAAAPATRPAAAKPAAAAPATTPGISTPAAAAPATTPGVSKPAASAPATTPAAAKPAADKPAVSTPAATTSEAAEPATTPPADKPTTSTPATANSATAKPASAPTNAPGSAPVAADAPTIIGPRRPDDARPDAEKPAAKPALVPTAAAKEPGTGSTAEDATSSESGAAPPAAGSTDRPRPQPQPRPREAQGSSSK
jgi:capsular exopolysaccharide synthesis family protein